TDSAIVPIVVGDEAKAVAISEALEREGFLVTAIRHPTVARGSALLRVALMSSHDRETLAAAAGAIARLVISRFQKSNSN
ncbi:MAG: aminotransferase class I/II-fold pyridoxal phosphate-dependent enzyme, partial [Kiritimatiellae bacterium]|nr:aminotransferase class I/II-fold pyridoxal phosphate-dependent enzyme [Kiritimatiellia bacterium]